VISTHPGGDRLIVDRFDHVALARRKATGGGSVAGPAAALPGAVGQRRKGSLDCRPEAEFQDAVGPRSQGEARSELRPVWRGAAPQKWSLKATRELPTMMLGPDAAKLGQLG